MNWKLFIKIILKTNTKTYKGDFSWGYYSGLIRLVAWLVCTCTWLLSVLFGSLLKINLNSHVVSQGLVHCLQKWRSHPLWDFLRPEPEDIGRQQENTLLSTGFLTKWSGCYWLWNLATCLPGFQVLLGHRQGSGVTLQGPLPRACFSEKTTQNDPQLTD
jgi:hypothetical protein